VIRVLSPEVINQIAAGEVIERPFSVLKELIENSIDAGSSRVEIELEEGGKARIAVRDDGRGMTAEDLELAFASHATSKLTSLDDLGAIVSLGFRGEALASIGSVARVRVLSRPADGEDAHEVRAEGGRVGAVQPAAAPPGTLIEVRDLFYNVPARRRFLKSDGAERARCLEVLQRLALGNPQCGFRLSGTRSIQLEPGETLRDRVAALFGRELAASCYPVSAERGGVTLEGLVADPDRARRDRTQEHLFLNGRPIKDRSLSHAVFEAYREYLMGGRYPVAFLFLTMDPASVDVNVHPTKAEVRFHDARLAYSVIRRGVTEALSARGRRVGLGEFAEAGSASAVSERPLPATGFPDLPDGLFGRDAAVGSGFGKLPDRDRAIDRSVEQAPPVQAELGRGSGSRAESLFRRSSRFLVVRDLYIVLETDGGFAVVDQHALHERVIYEQLLREWRDGNVPVQRLLVPVVLELPAADKEILMTAADALAKTGLLLADFGGNEIKVEGYPAALRHVRPKELVDGLVRDLRESGVPRELEDLRERFHSAACRSAVMAGDRLSDDEIEKLLIAAQKLEHPDNCPHGRPTVLNYSLGQLERFFRRRV